jgi:tRNA A22 N-methylase
LKLAKRVKHISVDHALLIICEINFNLDRTFIPKKVKRHPLQTNVKHFHPNEIFEIFHVQLVKRPPSV